MSVWLDCRIELMRSVEQAATLVTDSAKLPKIRTAIKACISAAPAALQAELWKARILVLSGSIQYLISVQNIIVTGGRTNATIVAAIKASLADAPQAERACCARCFCS